MNLAPLASPQFEKKLRLALSLDLPYPDHLYRNLLPQLRPAAVLLLLAEGSTGPELLFTKRTETVNTHKGQMSFPGGQCEENELTDTRVTALRETEEEVGVAPQQVKIIGRLPDLVTVSSFRVIPWVGIHKSHVSEIQFKMNPDEIAQTVWVSFRHLLEEGVYRQEKRDWQGQEYPIQVYEVEGHRIWGATGSMTKNLMDRLTSSALSGAPIEDL